jgi:hypothetical protein
MSLHRLTLTSAAMALVALALGALTPPITVLAESLGRPQATVDASGADALVLAAAGAAAWAVWAWGALGLALTALSAVPGAIGRLAELVVVVLLPAGARRAAALALGVSLGVAAPVLGWGGPVQPAYATPAAAGPSVPDWPTEPDTPAPEMPAPADTHVVVRGDCLWLIAADRLRAAGALPIADMPTDADIAVAVQAWWATNADVIGADPDLILPGQVLHAPQPVPIDPSEEPR